MKPSKIEREAVHREIRAVRAATARDSIGEFRPGCEIFLLTYGQFSLIDAIVAILRQTGPADLVLSSWTAGLGSLTTCARLLEAGELLSVRLIVDRSFENRQPEYNVQMRKLFGAAAIRTWTGHAKFAVIRSKTRAIAIRTSMNLNTNPRLETLEISDDPALADFLERVVDLQFQEQPPEVMRGDLPRLAALKFADKKKIKTGRAKMGRATASPTPVTTLRIG